MDARSGLRQHLRRGLRRAKHADPHPSPGRSWLVTGACPSRIANSLAESRVEATLRGARCLTYAVSRMKDLLLTLLHLAVMTAKLCGPGGVRAVIAENLLLKQQLIVLRRARQRAPNLTLSDRLICGLESLFLSPGRIRKVAIAVRPSSITHRASIRREWNVILLRSTDTVVPVHSGACAIRLSRAVASRRKGRALGGSAACGTCPSIDALHDHGQPTTGAATFSVSRADAWT